MFKTLKFFVILGVVLCCLGDKILLDGKLTIVKNKDQPDYEGQSLSKLIN